MAYDEDLASRLRAAAPAGVTVTEKKMFGGLCVMVGGNMACGVIGDELIVRCGDAFQELLAEPHTHAFDFTGKPMRGFVVVDADGCADGEELRAWVERGVRFAQSLPPK